MSLHGASQRQLQDEHLNWRRLVFELSSREMEATTASAMQVGPPDDYYLFSDRGHIVALATEPSGSTLNVVGSALDFFLSHHKRHARNSREYYD